jgi:alpha-L-arabinofuranosidase
MTQSSIWRRCGLLLAMTAGVVNAQSGTLSVQVDRPGVRISPSLYGIFFEEINYAGDGGLYPELLRNRNFEDNAERPEFWSLMLADGATGSATLKKNVSESAFNQHHLSLKADADSQGVVGVANDGYWGVSVQKGGIYRVYLRARSADVKKLTLSLQNRAGVVYGQTDVDPTWNSPAGFQTHAFIIRSDATDPSARLVVSIEQPGTVDIDYLSLKPEGEIVDGALVHKVGPGAVPYRPDLYQKLARLKPGFVRFPGGCWVEGETMATASRWKRTIGLPFERWTQPNLWGYHSTNGLGYHEYLQLCESLGADAMFVINVGMSHRDVVPMGEMGEYVQDALDAIEYAIGPADSTWGSLRAKAGHAEPFKLKYIQIGNENGGPRYDERYALFYDAIKAKYPQIQTIACDWGGRPRSRPIEIIDEHYYNTPQFFFNNAGKYDDYDRSGPKVYVGEYAVTRGPVGTGSLIAALGEAAFMTGMERNSDIVVMASYAPLFTHVNGKRWNPDLINFDSARSYGTPSYHVQTLFAQNRGDVVLPVRIELTNPVPSGADNKLAGRAGVGTWDTRVEYKDFQVLVDDQVVFRADADYSGFQMRGAGWRAGDGLLVQRIADGNMTAVAGQDTWKDYSVRVKARKLGGNEGFLILARDQGSENSIWLNVGGWGNSATQLERTWDGERGVIGPKSDFKVETDRWYDLRLDVKADQIDAYIDGQKLLSAADRPPVQASRVAATASRDETTGDVILKVVNGYDSPANLTLHLAGIGSVNGAAKAWVLTGEPLAENSLDAPDHVAPTMSSIDVGDGSFSHTFPKHSLTILRVPTAKR